jgi:glycine C-acetyltransferase
MGARMMSGNSDLHEQLEKELSAFVQKESTILCNFGYQAMVSAIDCMVDRHDVIVYDAESHACILDGVRLHMGKRYVFKHNDIEDCEKQLQRATKLAEAQNGSVLVITEGVFGMSGNYGRNRRRYGSGTKLSGWNRYLFRNFCKIVCINWRFYF